MNSEPATGPNQAQRKRPVLVWVFSIIYFLWAIYTFYSFAAGYLSFLPFHSYHAAHLGQKTLMSTLFDIGVNLLYLSGAIYLFLLKRVSFYLFLSALAFNFLVVAYYGIFTKVFAEMDPIIFKITIIALFIVWGILIAAILYIRKLIKNLVLQ